MYVKNMNRKSDGAEKPVDFFNHFIKSAWLVPAALILIELSFFLYAAWKGKGALYLRAAIPLYLVITAIYLFARFIGANERIVIWTAILLTIGVFVQVILIGHLTAQNNGLKSMLYEIHQLSEASEDELKEEKIPIGAYLSPAQAVEILSGVSIDFTDVKRAGEISAAEANKAGEYLESYEGFPDYKKELAKRTQIRENRQAGELVRNLIFGSVAAVLASLFLLFVCGHSYDVTIKLMIGLNLALLLIMLIFGKGVMGDAAKINLFGVQPLELIKLCYILVLTGLLCKPEKEEQKIWGLERGRLVILYMLVNAAFFVLLSELGTLLILTCTGLGFLFIFCKKRRIVLEACLVHAALLAAGIALGLSRFTVVGKKLYERFYYFVHPEADALGIGYQYIQLKKALAVSGWFGADGERYKFYIAAEETDAVFAKLIQMSGIVLAVLIIVCYLALMLEGYKAVYRSSDRYYRGLAAGAGIILAFQGIVHIACNVGLFPMTGVPLLYISKGGSNQMVSLVITAWILIISTKGMKRAVSDEQRFEEAEYGEKVKRFFI